MSSRVPSSNPVSPKLWAGLIGGSAGTIISTFLLWLIGAAIIDRWGADGVDNAIAAVPSPLAVLIVWLVAIGGALAGVYIKEDPERLPTLGHEQRQRVGLVGVETGANPDSDSPGHPSRRMS